VLTRLNIEQLDNQQRLAVESEAAPLCILAGPGSGKTRVLAHRIARRVEDASADPRHVLALTFTRQAANQLKDRLSKMGIRDLGSVGTFHAIALAQITQYRADAGRRAPVVLGNRRAVITELLGSNSALRPAQVTAEIDWAKAQRLEPDEYRHGAGRRRIGDRHAKLVADIFTRFNEYKKRRGILDFDDLLEECTRLLLSEASFRNAQRWIFRHFFVDEFQDLNSSQFGLLQAWLGDRKDLCVVGDGDQAIYGWNGADAQYLNDFRIFFPNAEVIKLDSNYRSSPEIVRAANAVIGKTQTGSAQESAPTKIFSAEYKNEEDEALGIASHLRSVREPETSWSRYAVLTRTNGQLLTIARHLEIQKIPYRLRGSNELLKLPQVNNLIDQLATSGASFSTTLSDLSTDFTFGPEAQFLEIAQQYNNDEQYPNGSSFRQWLKTLRSADYHDGSQRVELSTFHAAKGLEWPHVTIAGVEEGLVPLNNDDEEERRLFYVAISRAERQLFLTWAKERTVLGKTKQRNKSPWLSLIQTATARPFAPSKERVSDYLNKARSMTRIDLDVSSQERLNVLNDWRLKTARHRKIEPSSLIPDNALSAIAKAKPSSLEELAITLGQSIERVRKIGPEILSVVNGPT
jgi:DNA helicase-2/ATP-dependent DNA helicase PcrA